MTPASKRKNYLCPPTNADDRKKLVWAATSYSEGLAFLETQSGWRDLDMMEKIITGDDAARKLLPKNLSDVEVNRIRRQQQEMVSTYANIRPIAGFETDNAKYDDQCRILNKCTMAWYYAIRADQHVEGVLNYASISTGYLSPFWRSDFYGAGEGEIDLKVLDTRQVVPFQLPPDNDLQRAYAVFITEDWPIALVHATWKDFAENISADNGKGLLGTALDYVRSKFRSPLLAALDKRDKRQIGIYETVTVRYVYINDKSINEGKEPVKMGLWSEDGKASANWSYEVPALGDPIPLGYKVPTGRYDVSNGDEIYQDATRPADESDCLLYPQRRLMIIAGESIVYDGPSYWWHGEVPAIPFRLERWPKEYLGISPFRTNVSLQQSNNRLHRVVDDKAEVLCDPPLMGDDAVITETDFRKVNLRQPGQRLRVNTKTLAGEKPIKLLVEETALRIPPEVTEHIEKQNETMDYLVALEGSTAIFRATQQPAADTIEKMLEMIGPVPVARSKMMEASIAQMGRQVGSLILQWYDRRRRMRLLGPVGVTREDFEEFDPDSMIPTEIEGRPDLTQAHRVKRARHFQGMLRFRIVHKSLHELTQTTTKMAHLQMQRGGMMVSEGTIAKDFEMENYIKYPADLVTEAEKWAYEQEFKATTIAKIQAAVSQMQPQQDGGLQQVVQQFSDMFQNNQGNPTVGRKPSGEQAPQLQTKSDQNGNQRTTISESGR